jgi:hypothetical protein
VLLSIHTIVAGRSLAYRQQTGLLVIPGGDDFDAGTLRQLVESEGCVRTTEAYLRVGPSEKLEAMEAVLPPSLRRGRFRAPDALIASFQESS